MYTVVHFAQLNIDLWLNMSFFHCFPHNETITFVADFERVE
jgi:hypothetical protein